jgi:signal peptidase II
MDRRFINFLLVAFTVFFIDLFTKYLAEKFLDGRSITIIPEIFNLVLVWNRGAAFGFLATAPEIVRKLMLIFVSLIAAVLTIAYAYTKRHSLSKLEFYSLALIAGGALGNLYDRIFLGAVRDFLDFHIGEYHWPAFNIADASITVGILLFLFNEFFLKKRHLDVQKETK